MFYKVLQEFEVPGLPLFLAGDTCKLEEETAKAFVERGLLEEASKPKPSESTKATATKEDKKVDDKSTEDSKKKSNK